MLAPGQNLYPLWHISKTAGSYLMTKDSLGLDASPLNYSVGCVVYLGINLSFNADESVV